MKIAVCAICESASDIEKSVALINDYKDHGYRHFIVYVQNVSIAKQLTRNFIKMPSIKVDVHLYASQMHTSSVYNDCLRASKHVYSHIAFTTLDNRMTSSYSVLHEMIVENTGKSLIISALFGDIYVVNTQDVYLFVRPNQPPRLSNGSFALI